jgi:hypothetical protein
MLQALGTLSAAGTSGATTGAVVQFNNEEPQLNENAQQGYIELQGTWVGTVQFEQSIDNGTTWFGITGTPMPSGTAVSSATGNGLWQFNINGVTNLRARASAWTSGTAQVVIS